MHVPMVESAARGTSVGSSREIVIGDLSGPPPPSPPRDPVSEGNEVEEAEPSTHVGSWIRAFEGPIKATLRAKEPPAIDDAGGDDENEIFGRLRGSTLEEVGVSGWASSPSFDPSARYIAPRLAPVR